MCICYFLLLSVICLNYLYYLAVTYFPEYKCLSRKKFMFMNFNQYFYKNQVLMQ